MPTINQTKSGGVISFGAQDFLSGLYPQYQTSINATPGYISDQLLVARAFHPYRSLGYASPGFDATDLTNASVISGMLRNVCFGAEGGTNYAYPIGSDDKLHRIDISTKTISNGGSWPHSISGVGAETGNDCVTYNMNVAGVRTPCVMYSWNDSGGAWNVGIFNTAAGTFDDDFMTTVPATPLVASGNNKPHPMIVGADDLHYIADGNVLHSFDGATGANGTFETTRLRLPAGYIITSFAKLPDFLAVFAYYSPSGDSVAINTLSSGPAIAVLWDYLELDPTYVIPINDNAVSAAFEYKGTIGCFTQGDKPVQESENRFCTLQIWNGSSFDILANFIGNPPIHGGVDVIDNSIQWNSDGAVHCYGSPLLGAPEGLNKINESDGTTSGLLRTVGGISGFQLISSGTTTTGGAEYFKVGTYGDAGLMQTSAATPYFPPGTIGKIKRIGVKFGKTCSGGRVIDMSLIKDNGTAVQFTSALGTVTASTLTQFFDRTISGAYFGSFEELSLALQWQAGSGETSAPVPRSVDVEYEIENLVANT